MQRRTSETGVKFIAQHEGFRAQLYNDAAGHATVGYGHLVHKGEVGTDLASEAPFSNGISEAEAAELLRSDLEIAEEAVNRLVRASIRQAQFDALVSFVFNVGVGAFSRATLLSKLNAGFCCAVPYELRRWTLAGKRRLAGLVVRREDEARMFAEGGANAMIGHLEKLNGS